MLVKMQATTHQIVLLLESFLEHNSQLYININVARILYTYALNSILYKYNVCDFFPPIAIYIEQPDEFEMNSTWQASSCVSWSGRGKQGIYGHIFLLPPCSPVCCIGLLMDG